MNRLLLVFALIGTAPKIVFGRLGETEAQLIERYGKVVMRAPESVIEQGKVYTLANNLHFKSDDWSITARLVAGRCESIWYGKPGEWTDAQLRHVLEANGSRSRWEERKTANSKYHRHWLRRDGATATWRILQGMSLETPAYVKARSALKQRAKDEASKLPKI